VPPALHQARATSLEDIDRQIRLQDAQQKQQTETQGQKNTTETLRACQEEKTVSACAAAAGVVLRAYPTLGIGTQIDLMGDSLNSFDDPAPHPPLIIEPKPVAPSSEDEPDASDPNTSGAGQDTDLTPSQNLDNN